MQKTMDLTNHHGYTALHLAAMKGDIESANCILDEGAYIDYKDKVSTTKTWTSCLVKPSGEKENECFLHNCAEWKYSTCACGRQWRKRYGTVTPQGRSGREHQKLPAAVSTVSPPSTCHEYLVFQLWPVSSIALLHSRTPIMLAAMHDQVSCGKLLLEDERTEVSGLDAEGMTTRDYASKHSYLYVWITGMHFDCHLTLCLCMASFPFAYCSILQAINKCNEEAIASGRWAPPRPDPQGLFGRKICIERGLPVPDLPLFCKLLHTLTPSRISYVMEVGKV